MSSVYRSVGTAPNDLAIAAEPRLVVYGVSVAESAASAAVASVEFKNGVDGTAPTLLEVTVPASSTHSIYFESGIPFPDGVTVERIAGDTSVTILYRNT